jgi:hypothetical protein
MDVATRMTAQQIHELVTGDGPHPGRQRLFWVVGMAFVVNRQQQFLQQILHLVRQASELPPQIGSQMRREFVQEYAVDSRVPGETLQHQASEALLNQLHLNLLVTAHERGESFSTPQKSPVDLTDQPAYLLQAFRAAALKRAADSKPIGAICMGLELGSAGDLRAQSSSPRGPAVVELYTSQGCSSCPPADALLGELSQMPNVLALAFHVDYWDSIGWRDHFALPIASERRRRYVETLGLSSAFTPQVVVDGRSSVDSFPGDATRIAVLLQRAQQGPIVAVESRADASPVGQMPATDWE